MADHAGGMSRRATPAGALFRRVFLINGLIFVLGTLILALSPATVSARIKLTEIPVLVIGLAVMLTANALLLRSSLAPLDRLAASMRRVDPPKRSDRVEDRGTGDLHHLIASFNAMLDRLETERTTASASALAAQENERQRIARELHDEIGQILTVALLMLKRAVDRSPVEIRGELADTQEAVRAGLDEVRSIARRLRPDALEDLGLHSALNALCSEFAQASGIVVVKHIATQSDRVGSDVELVCYRIAQESLTNVARHARASKVWLDLHVTADQLTLRIADDGCGGVVGEGSGINRHARTCAAGERRSDDLIAARGGHRGAVGDTPAERLMSARILLADDHALVRSGLRMILDAEPDLQVVAEAADGHVALSALDETPVDLAILDIAMPRMTGLQAAREINRTHPHVRILILSMYDNEQYFFEALKAGASGYVLKSVADRDLLEACRATLRGEPFLYAGAVTALIRDYLHRARQGDALPDTILTPREEEVLKLIAEGYSTREIATTLGISAKTVDRHRTNTLAKLGLRDRLALTRYAIRAGLIEP